MIPTNIGTPPGYANSRAPDSLHDLLRVALAPDNVHGALTQALDVELLTPSFHPGDDFATTAWREGRKAVLVELIRKSERQT